MNEFIWRWY